MSEQDEYAKAFPQASKLDVTKKTGPLLHQFLGWLSTEKGYVLAKWEPDYETDHDECPDEHLVRVFVDPRTLILEFCNVDSVAYEAEIERMLEQLHGFDDEDE